MLWIVVIAAVGLALALLAVGLSNASQVLHDAPAAANTAERQNPPIGARAG